MFVIMLGGLGRVGKTTFAEMLSKEFYELGYWPKKLSMATPIKTAAKEAGYSKEKDAVEYRRWLQKTGAAERAKNPAHWVDLWHDLVMDLSDEETTRFIQNYPFSETVIIVDDCRYMNEVAAGRHFDAFDIFIMKGDREIEDEKGEWRAHESEALAQAVESQTNGYGEVFGYCVRNDKGLKELRELARQTARHILAKRANEVLFDGKT